MDAVKAAVAELDKIMLLIEAADHCCDAAGDRETDCASVVLMDASNRLSNVREELDKLVKKEV
jgi:hypothetical protein